MNKKVTGIIGYIGIIGWLIAYLAGDKEGAKFHLNQGLVLAIISLACSAISWVTGWIPVVGSLIGILVWVVNVITLVLTIMGIVAAAKDEEKVLPIIGGIKILK